MFQFNFKRIDWISAAFGVLIHRDNVMAGIDLCFLFWELEVRYLTRHLVLARYFNNKIQFYTGDYWTTHINQAKRYHSVNKVFSECQEILETVPWGIFSLDGKRWTTVESMEAELRDSVEQN